MTKRQQILDHLNEHGWIDSWTAITKFRATRLADDIYQLERQGKVRTIHSKQSPTYTKYLRVSKCTNTKASTQR